MLYSMKIEITNINENLLNISLKGKLNLDNISIFENKIKKINSKRIHTIVLDLSKLEQIDSSGIGSIMKARNTVNNSKTEFVLYDIPEHIINIFKVSYLDKFFIIKTRKELREMFPDEDIK